MTTRRQFSAGGLARLKAASAARMRKLHADPEFAERHASRGRKTINRLRADPEFLSRQKAASAAALKEKWQDPDYRARKSAEQSARLKRIYAEAKQFRDGGPTET